MTEACTGISMMGRWRTMGQRLLVLLAFTLLTLSSGCNTRADQPTYRGRGPDYWRQELLNEREKSGHPLLTADSIFVTQPSTDSLPVLRCLLRDKDGGVRWLALVCLRYLDELARPALPDVVALLNDPDPQLQQLAAGTLGALRGAGRDALEPLAARFQSPKPLLRLAAAGATVAIDPTSESAFNVLEELITGSLKDEFERFTAMEYLGGIELKDNRAAALLLAILHDEHPKSDIPTGYAAEALGRLKSDDPRIVPDLEKAMKHRGAYVRANAAHAIWLRTKDGGKSLPILIDVLRTEINDPVALWAAITGVSAMGQQARAAVPTLLGLIEQDQDVASDVRRFAAEALQRIDPEMAKKARIPKAPQ
jgi:HEAT repeat protein